MAKVCLFLHIGTARGFNQSWLWHKMKQLRSMRQESKARRLTHQENTDGYS